MKLTHFLIQIRTWPRPNHHTERYPCHAMPPHSTHRHQPRSLVWHRLRPKRRFPRLQRHSDTRGSPFARRPSRTNFPMRVRTQRRRDGRLYSDRVRRRRRYARYLRHSPHSMAGPTRPWSRRAPSPGTTSSTTGRQRRTPHTNIRATPQPHPTTTTATPSPATTGPTRTTRAASGFPRLPLMLMLRSAHPRI